MSEERITATASAVFADAVLGTDFPHPGDDAFRQATLELDARYQDELKLAAQVQELYLIRQTADSIEEDFKSKGLELPNVFVVYTAGFDAPADATEIAPYGTGPLVNLLKADIGGHSGIAGALKIDDAHTASIWIGRAHAFTGVGDKFAEMLYGRPMNVIKELVRRQRERGKQCAIILTYLTGADESTELTKGDVGVVIDWTEQAGGRATLAAGAGPHNVLDRVLGERFQPKLRRGSDVQLARSLKKFAKKQGVRIGAVAAVGTADTTNYQGAMDQGAGLGPFERKRKKLKRIAHETLGKKARVSLLFDMSVAFDVNNVRILQHREHTNKKDTFDEQEIPLLILGLPTDIVGADSEDVGHTGVVDEAKKHGEDNGQLVRTLVEHISKTIDETHPLVIPPDWVLPKFSIRGQFDEM